MKKIFFLFMTALYSICSFSQSNNPYNQRGIDFANSISLIKKDYSSGKVTSINSTSLQYYSARVPLQNQVTVDMATSIVNKLKTSGVTIDQIINSSALSSFSKQILINSVHNPSNLSYSKYRLDLTSKVNQIQGSAIIVSEKEIVLSLIAILYNNAIDTSTRAQCAIQGPDGSGVISCSLAGAVGGAIIGGACCGPLGALGGAIIGGVVGSLS